METEGDSNSHQKFRKSLLPNMYDFKNYRIP